MHPQDSLQRLNSINSEHDQSRQRRSNSYEPIFTLEDESSDLCSRVTEDQFLDHVDQLACTLERSLMVNEDFRSYEFNKPNPQLEVSCSQKEIYALFKDLGRLTSLMEAGFLDSSRLKIGGLSLTVNIATQDLEFPSKNILAASFSSQSPSRARLKENMRQSFLQNDGNNNEEKVLEAIRQRKSELSQRRRELRSLHKKVWDETGLLEREI